MDSQLWHDYCTAEMPEEPPPLTVRQWNGGCPGLTGK
jgi:hypothetical protein